MGNLGKVLACLKELKFKPNVDNFQDKLVIQKTVCLLELSGINLDYPFSLYVRGPYSPTLTSELYTNKPAVNTLRSKEVLNEKEKQQLKNIHELSNSLDPTLLEIMSTYLFLIKCMEKEERQAIIDLKKLKSFFSEGKIAVGISRAKQLAFNPTEKEIERMKAEFREWEEASMADQE